MKEESQTKFNSDFVGIFVFPHIEQVREDQTSFFNSFARKNKTKKNSDFSAQQFRLIPRSLLPFSKLKLYFARLR